jgi:arylsulfatase A-like enzyme
VIRRFSAAVLAAQIFAALELFVVLIVHAGRLASIVEAERGSFWLAPTLLAGAAFFGLTGGAAGLLLERGTKLDRALLAGFAGLAGAVVGYAVGGGRHLATLGARGGFALAVGAAGALAVFFAYPGLRGLLERRPRRFSAAVFGLVLAFEVMNRFVLVRLYPPFHQALAGAALALVPVALLPFWEPLTRRIKPAVWLAAASALTLSALALVAPSARRLAGYDNYRIVLVESAPIAREAVELAARIAPPEPWDTPSCEAPGACAGAGISPATGRTLDWRGRDILLVTIDALRADHVGAYGYARKTTPNLDRLAHEGALFERAYTATPHTSYAVASLMTGKYMRPLLLQGMGADSDTWAGLLRTYGYRTAAFYPPAIFFIDPLRFEDMKRRSLDFEYRWVEFAEGAERLGQIERYLGDAPGDRPLFVWVHLFGPHEPYEAHPEYPFGDRDIDRYDSEVARADATLGRIVEAFVRRRQHAAVVVTADHGEEFGDHGGRYHGTSVYEEQVRVPLVVWAPGAVPPKRSRETVELVDLLPTVLGALDIPKPPRLRGHDLGPLLTGVRADEPGTVYAETEDYALLGKGSLRLICARRLGACQLFDIERDPGQKRDLSAERATEQGELRALLRELGASHGRFELGGLRAEGKGWPPAIRRGLSGDGEAASEIAELLDDADVAVRRKAGEVLFELRRPETAAALRLALGREEDAETRAWAALGLTRLGQGAPLVAELFSGGDARFQRLAALALGEAGDRRGQGVLVEWWKDAPARDFERSRQILAVLGELKVKDALYPLVQSLGDVRLRPYIARALSRIGDEAAIGALVRAFADERLQSTRVALADALVELGAREEMAVPLRRFLGVPDPLPGGLGLAVRAKILEHVGGPSDKELARLRKNAELGQVITVVVPSGGNGRGVRVIVRARAATPGEVLVSSAQHLVSFDREGKVKRKRGVPDLDPKRVFRVEIPVGPAPVEVAAVAPAALSLRPGGSSELVVYASSGVTVDAVSFVPLADELPPPPKEPWKPEGPG